MDATQSGPTIRNSNISIQNTLRKKHSTGILAPEQIHLEYNLTCACTWMFASSWTQWRLADE